MGASTSVVTLSVSTISSGSPLARRSPSCFSHSRTVPDSMVWPRLGIPNFTAMGFVLYATRSRAEASSFSTLGTASFSNTGLKGMGTSAAATRRTGASR